MCNKRNLNLNVKCQGILNRITYDMLVLLNEKYSSAKLEIKQGSPICFKLLQWKIIIIFTNG